MSSVSIDWENREIFIPKTYTSLVQLTPTEIRQLDLDVFRRDLRELEGSSEGMVYPSTHDHFAPVDIGGVSLARVVQIINGYTITIEDGQYAVNLVNANTNVQDRTNVNQVSIRPSNSAGLIFNDAIESQSFLDGRVYIDRRFGVEGTNFPIGSPSKPSNNIVDAYSILLKRGYRKINLIGILGSGLDHLGSPDPENVLTSQYNFSQVEFYGTAPLNSVIVLSGAVTEGLGVERCAVIGVFNGYSSLSQCQILAQGVSNFSGLCFETGIEGSIQIESSNTSKISIINCFSNLSGIDRPVLDLNNAPCELSIRNYTGGLKITNFTQNQNASIDCRAATIEIDSTCTNGTINIGGLAKVIDNSGPNCNVITSRTSSSLVSDNEDVLLTRDHARAANLQTKSFND